MYVSRRGVINVRLIFWMSLVVTSRALQSSFGIGSRTRYGISCVTCSRRGFGHSSTTYPDWITRLNSAVSTSESAGLVENQQQPHYAVLGGGFAGLSVAYYLTLYGAKVTIVDDRPVGMAQASSVAAGLLHPLTPRGKLIWKGAEGLAAAFELIEVIRHTRSLPRQIGFLRELCVALASYLPQTQ